MPGPGTDGVDECLMLDFLSKDVFELTLVEDQHAIEAFPTDGAMNARRMHSPSERALADDPRSDQT